MDIQKITDIAREAGKRILNVYNKNEHKIYEKEDRSPLTEADLISHEYICDALSSIDSSIPILSEESAEKTSYDIRKKWDKFWLVDPLDGTKEFIKRNGEFTVNIALIKNGYPILGVIYAPVLDLLYYAKLNEGAYLQEDNLPPEKLPKNLSNNSILRVVASKSHYSQQTESLIEKYADAGKKIEKISVGSSLKFCQVAEGTADIYPRMAPTMEWDTAAGHIIAKESNKKVINFETKEELQYNKKNLLNPWFVVE